MGSDCCKENQAEQSFDNNPIVDLAVDNDHSFRKSYTINRNVFRKEVYNWHCIPFKNIINWNQSYQQFQIKSHHIKDSSFVIGLIKQSAIGDKMPWQSRDVICLQSHYTSSKTGVLYNNQYLQTGIGGLVDGKTMKVVIDNSDKPMRNQRDSEEYGSSELRFEVEGTIIGRQLIPKSLTKARVLPYICLFHEGDEIQIISTRM